MSDVLQAMDTMGHAYQVVGDRDDIPRVFASIRNPVANGIYFLDGITPPSEASGSLFLVRSADYDTAGGAALVVDNPQLRFYQLMRFFYASGDASSGIHPTAIVDPDAVIHPAAYIGPYCVIGRAHVGAGVNLHSHVTIFDGSVLEDGVTIEPHSTIGATGVAWAWDAETNTRVRQPQIGGVIIGAGSFLGSDVSVVRGSVNEDTVVGENCVIAHGSKIGHGCRIGNDVHMANNISIAGNVDIGDQSFLGAGSVIRPQVRMHSGTILGAGAVLASHTDEPDGVWVGVPAKRQEQKKQRLSGVPQNQGDKQIKA
ncbi:UDP-3-O-acylglucosamine N-acyltransferase [Kordiimonas sediminis]|uniref:UDP-3-O-acylglucosamine N-acyltransferase n=1 Tax=Kordiimonas sediminis TaxID=1735581 RepID=A0A919ALK7_9PROT|nr:DapH/DapD/GlmU-related protein [Kordiimonas sediminis]GHF14622.1 UDP-3-O-acylglucosamine N-acyltransferase [Kordiimonas sediminis]